MTERFELAIVGAGPAGMAAALEAKARGLSAVVLDEQPRPGGQIYRRAEARDARLEAALGAEYAHGMALTEKFLAGGVAYRPNTTLWDLSPELRLSVLRDNRAGEIDAAHVILATGAMERPVPVRGWILPGAMSVGAAQILLKTTGAVPDKPAVLAGSGPLLYLLAAQYLAAGVEVRALVETQPGANYRAAAPYLLPALWQRKLLLKGAAMLRDLRKHGVKRWQGASSLAVEGNDACTALTFAVNGKRERIETELVLLHEGVIPNVHVTMAINGGHDWDATQLCWRPRLDAWGATSVDGVSVAGDGGGIWGAEAAEHTGRIAALGAAQRLGKISEEARDRAASHARASLARLRGARQFLDLLYKPAPGQRLPPDDVIVCRCEEVTAGTLREVARIGAIGLTQAKTYTRCGMGPCQGRMCGPTVAALVADERKMPEASVPPYRPRAPYKPVTIGALAAAVDADTPPPDASAGAH
ncbi:MAG: NAD(P)/FAD-dependent oxidoreductase [Alphaproteobacteria bacterium]|nr:NAD(P)/FAD-dependent oxidoreductase [Alphaproteobacteria bacterium]